MGEDCTPTAPAFLSCHDVWELSLIGPTWRCTCLERLRHLRSLQFRSSMRRTLPITVVVVAIIALGVALQRYTRSDTLRGDVGPTGASSPGGSVHCCWRFDRTCHPIPVVGMHCKDLGETDGIDYASNLLCQISCAYGGASQPTQSSASTVSLTSASSSSRPKPPTSVVPSDSSCVWLTNPISGSPMCGGHSNCPGTQYCKPVQTNGVADCKCSAPDSNKSCATDGNPGFCQVASCPPVNGQPYVCRTVGSACGCIPKDQDS